MKRILSFILVITTLITLTGCGKNMDYIVIFTDDLSTLDIGVDVKPNSTFKKPAAVLNAETTTHAGYTFKGWFDLDTDKPFDFSSKIGRDYEVHARWDINKYRINYHKNLGNETSPNPTTYTINDTFFLNALDRGPSYYFNGWFLESTFKTRVFAIDRMSEELNLYAKFTHTDTFNVVIDFITSGEPLAPISINMPQTLSLPTPEKGDSRFSGWFFDPYFQLEVSKDFKFTDNTTLYARFIDLTTTINYHFETGIEIQTISRLDEFKLLAGPVIEDKIFRGWFVDEALYELFSPEKHLNAEIVNLYPKLDDVIYYEVSFETFGGTTIENIVFSEFETLTLPENPKKKNHLFEGWFLDSDFSIPFENKITRLQTTLYAKLTPISIVTVSFETFDANKFSPVTISQFDSLILPTPILDGHIFGGWFTDLGLTIPFDENIINRPKASFTLYAKIEIIVATVTLMVNDEISQEIILTSPSKLSLNDPVVTNKVFEGWYLEASFATTFSPDTVVDADLILYAKMRNELFFTITFNPSNGDAPVVVTISEFDQLVLPNNPLLDAHLFIQWNNSDSSLPFDPNEKITSDLSLIATFRTLENFTVSFETFSGSSIGDILVVENDMLVLPTSPSLVDSIFVGWYLDNTLTTPYDNDLKITQNIILYAKYRVLLVYVISFETFGATDISDINVTESSNLLLPTKPVKERHTFSAWYLDQNFDTPFAANHEFTSNATLYAKFIPIEYVIVSFETFGGTEILELELEIGAYMPVLPTATKDALFFAGWFTDTSFSKVYGRATVSSSFTIYALFTGSQTVKNETELADALANPLINEILITLNINITMAHVINRELTLFGNKTATSLNIRTGGSLTINTNEAVLIRCLLISSVRNFAIEMLLIIEDSHNVTLDGVRLTSKNLDVVNAVQMTNSTLKTNNLELIGFSSDASFKLVDNSHLAVKFAGITFALTSKLIIHDQTSTVDLDLSGGQSFTYVYHDVIAGLNHITPQVNFTFNYLMPEGNNIEITYEHRLGELQNEVFPYMDGYIFKAWYDREKPSAHTPKYDFSKPLEASSIVYGKWDKVQFTVKFITNQVETMDDILVKYKDTLPLLTVPLLEDLILDGWYLDNQFTTAYNLNTPVTSDLILYAKWKEKIAVSREIAAVLQAVENFYLLNSFTSETTGSITAQMGTNITQVLSATKKKFGDTASITTLSEGMMSVKNSVYASGSNYQVKTLQEEWKTLTELEFINTVGVKPSELNYTITIDNILSASLISETNNTYVIKLSLHPVLAVDRYAVSINFNNPTGASEQPPAFEYVNLIVTIDKNTKHFKQIDSDEAYVVAAMGFQVRTVATITEMFSNFNQPVEVETPEV